MSGELVPRNPTATCCVRCGVLLLSYGGVVRSSEGTTWPGVWCLTCLRRDQNPHADIPSITPTAAAWTTLRILGLRQRCWRCTHPELHIVGLSPYSRYHHSSPLLTTQDPNVMSAAEDLLRSIGRADITATRESSTCSPQFVACARCGSRRQRESINTEAMARVSGSGLDGLHRLGLAPCWTARWQKMLHSSDRPSMYVLADSTSS